MRARREQETTSQSRPSPVQVRVRRQDGPDRPETRRWERFEVGRTGLATVADLIDRINLRPHTTTDDAVEPIVWESSCTWPTCGSCTMLINGQVALACATSLEDAVDKQNKLVLEPLSKFPLRRDLWVDRSSMAQARARLMGWAEPKKLNERPTESESSQRERLAHGRCTACGCCLEACPEYRPGRPFAGATAINRAHHGILFHPANPSARLDALLGPSGIGGCGQAHNCVEVCPQHIPLDDALALASRRATRHWLGSLWGRKRRPKG